ncbi:MAG: hypothetical protein B6A08_17150 [Sorangiineae bacterium NIC37A_2]|jgi:hypothetical protein|nr:MAG: hypothetical protein B6A08_17150 [Sorangiineae bacterium NIC37A_2]
MSDQESPMNPIGIKRTIAYVLLWLALIVAVFAARETRSLPNWLLQLDRPLGTSLMGALAGVLYLIRGIYTNFSVFSTWDFERWWPWYFLRPFASAILGGVSPVFVEMGLMAFGAPGTATASAPAYLAVAFIVGLNVARSLERLEAQAKEKLGIKRSNAAESNDRE